MGGFDHVVLHLLSDAEVTVTHDRACSGALTVHRFLHSAAIQQGDGVERRRVTAALGMP
jgi:hypothetical protein